MLKDTLSPKLDLDSSQQTNKGKLKRGKLFFDRGSRPQSLGAWALAADRLKFRGAAAAAAAANERGQHIAHNDHHHPDHGHSFPILLNNAVLARVQAPRFYWASPIGLKCPDRGFLRRKSIQWIPLSCSCTSW